MRKLNIVLSLAATLLLGLSHAQADTVNGFVTDFNTTINTSSHTFAPPAWDHIAASYYSEYPEYTYYSTGGYENSGYLYVGSQNVGMESDWGDYTEDVNDVLVMPKYKGTATIYLRKHMASGSAKFFFVKVAPNGRLSLGSQRTDVDVSALNKDGFVKITLPDLGDSCRIGIRGEYLDMDQFEANGVEVERKLSISSCTAASTKPEVNASGTYPVSYSVSLKNDGGIDLKQGDKNFSVSIFYDSSKNDTLVTVPVPQDLAAGETSKAFNVSVDVPYNKYPKGGTFRVCENISGTNKWTSTITPVPYEGKFALKDGSSTLSDGSSLSFGTVNSATTKTLTVQNDGTAPIILNTISLTGSFTTDAKAPLTVAAKSSANINITLPVDTYGKKTGTLTIKGDSADVTIQLSGLVIDPSKWYVDFESGTLPVNIVNGGSWTVDNKPLRQRITGDQKAAKSSQYNETKLISPLLSVSEGETLSFDASQQSDYPTPVLDIYYSTDRKEWTKAQSFTVSGENLGSEYSPYFAIGNYVVNSIPAGNYYIAFSGKNVYIDNIYGYKVVAVDHDLVLTSSDIPSEGDVNSTYTASATLYNANTKDVTSDEYTATLYVDGEPAATAASKAIASGKSATFSFSYTPHNAGTKETYIEFATGDYKVSTDKVNAVIAEETNATDKQVGSDKSGTVNSALNLNQSGTTESEAIYTSGKLGLKVGSKITKITFRGYAASDSDIPDLKVQLGSTEDSTYQSPYAFHDVLTTVYSGSASVAKGGSGSASSSPWVGTVANIITVNLSEPYVYDGKNLIVRVSATGTSKTVVFSADNTVTDKTIYKTGSSDIALDVKQPVIILTTTSDPFTVSGKVSDNSGTAITGAKVELTSGDVAYTTTTDTDGKYSVAVLKDNLTYQFTVTKEGYFPYKESDITVKESIVKDVKLSAAEGFYIEEVNIPSSAEIGNSIVVTAKAQNSETEDIKADGYVARLYFNNQSVAKTKSVDVAAGESATFTWAFTPYEKGTFPAYVEFKTSDGKTSVSPTVNVTVGDESSSGEKAVGTANASVNNNPVYLYHEASQSQTIYPKELLGLPENAKITKISYKGYTGNLSTDISSKVKVYIGNTDDESYASSPSISNTTNGLTKVYDGTVTFTKNVGSASSPESLIDITLATPFEYTGKALKIFVQAESSKTTSTVFFEADNTVSNNSYRRGADSGYDEDTYEYETADDAISYTSWTKSSSIPVVHLTYTVPAAVTLAVGADGYATFSSAKALDFSKVEGLTANIITTNNGDYVTYKQVNVVPDHTGLLLKGAEGIYTVPVATANTDAVSDNLLLQTADGSVVNTEHNIYILSDGSNGVGFYRLKQGANVPQGKAYITSDVSSAKEFISIGEGQATGINGITAETELDGNAPMYNISGQKVSKAYRGIVIQNGKKYISK